MRLLIALAVVAALGTGCASHHAHSGSSTGALNSTSAPHASTTTKNTPRHHKSTASSRSPRPGASTGAAHPTTSTTTTHAATSAPQHAPSYVYRMSGVLPDVFPGGTGNTSTADVTVQTSVTSAGTVFSYPVSNGRVAELVAHTSTGWFKRGDGNGTNSHACAWSPPVRETGTGSWHVDSTCSVTAGGRTTRLHLVEDARVAGSDSVAVGSSTVHATRVHRTGTLTVTSSGSTQTTSFTEDVWWLVDRGAVAKASASSVTKQTYGLTSNTVSRSGSLQLLAIR